MSMDSVTIIYRDTADKGGAPRADLPAGKSVRHAGPVNRGECHTRIKRVMRHDPSSPAGTSAGGKTGYFAGPGNPISRAGKSCRSTNHRPFARSATPTNLLSVLKHVRTNMNLTLMSSISVPATHSFFDIEYLARNQPSPPCTFLHVIHGFSHIFQRLCTYLARYCSHK